MINDRKGRPDFQMLTYDVKIPVMSHMSGLCIEVERGPNDEIKCPLYKGRVTPEFSKGRRSIKKNTKVKKSKREKYNENENDKSE